MSIRRLPLSLSLASGTLRLAAIFIGLVAAFPVAPASAASATARMVEVRKIWDAGEHNAFTDLIRWRGAWWCTFREAQDHVGGDGKIRILTSRDGSAWESTGLLTEAGMDLRDPKLSIMPDGRLMVNCGGSLYAGTKVLKGRQPRVAFSADGKKWTAPVKILEDGHWLWRVTWHDGVAYGASYLSGLGGSTAPGPEWKLKLVRSCDGLQWDLVTDLPFTGRPNETTLRFKPNGDMVAMVRREVDGAMGHLGVAAPPYTQWTWRVSNHRLGGPNFIALPDGRWIAGTRDYTKIKPGVPGGATTLIAGLNLNDGQLAPLVTLPSAGDNSYPGLVWHEGLLWVSYYASHEGKTSIYLAKVQLDRAK
jgi:hypothetical protein